MRRAAWTVALGLVLGACAIPGLDDGGPGFGPEQFRFQMEPGDGPGTFADELARHDVGVGSIVEPGTPNHLASVQTPLGRMDIAEWTIVGGDHCLGKILEVTATVTCRLALEPNGDDPIVRGGGSEGPWSEVTLFLDDDVAQVIGVAEDGTVYTIVPAHGVGVVVWPTSRGRLTLRAFDAKGVSLGAIDSDGAPMIEEDE